MTPFFATYGFHPKTGVEPPTPHTGPTLARADQRDADQLVDKWEKLWDYLKLQSDYAKERQAFFANRSRQEHPKFAVGDEVMLDRRFVTTLRPSRKLDQKHLGPFPIKRIVHNGHAYELDLPSSIKIHPVFHPWLLHPRSKAVPYPGQKVDKQPPIQIEREGNTVEEFEVKDVIGSRFKGRGKKNLEYLVQ